jgi:hypothetical protein
MATTTRKTPKAKTKTSKSTSRTAAAKTRASRATTAKKAPAQAKKAEAVKPAKTVKAVSIKGKVVTIAKLHSLHLMSAGLFVLLALAAGFVMNNTSYQLTIGHLAKDDLASTSNTVFAPAWQAIWDVQLRWLVVGILALSAVPQLLYMGKLRNRYDGFVQNTRLQPMRWFDLGVTFALMTEVAALLSGVHDMTVLKLMGGTVLVSFMLSLIAERQNSKSDRMVSSAFVTSLLAGILPWLLIATYAVFTVVYGAVRSPWYVYATYAALLVGWLLLVRNQRFQYKKANDYLVVERNYLVINLLTKAAFAVILIAGVR